MMLLTKMFDAKIIVEIVRDHNLPTVSSCLPDLGGDKGALPESPQAAFAVAEARTPGLFNPGLFLNRDSNLCSK